MAAPPLSGLTVSLSGVAIERQSSFVDEGPPSLGLGGIGNVGIGLLVALLVLAYWYRRVL